MTYTQAVVHAYILRRFAAVIALGDYELVDNGVKFTRNGVDVRAGVLNDDEDSAEVDDLEWVVEIDGVKHYGQTFLYDAYPIIHDAITA